MLIPIIISRTLPPRPWAVPMGNPPLPETFSHRDGGGVSSAVPAHKNRPPTDREGAQFWYLVGYSVRTGLGPGRKLRRFRLCFGCPPQTSSLGATQKARMAPQVGHQGKTQRSEKSGK